MAEAGQDAVGTDETFIADKPNHCERPPSRVAGTSRQNKLETRLQKNINSHYWSDVNAMY
jgi:hypothetical protein